MENVIKMVSRRKTAKVAPAPVEKEPRPSAASKSPTPSAESKSPTPSPASKTPTPSPAAKTRKARVKPTDTVLSEEQITYLLKHFENFLGGNKLTDKETNGLRKTFSKIRIMRPKTFAETRSFYDKKKRSNEDEIYHQATVRIDNFFKYGDYHDFKYDGSYDKNGNL
jgi:hypothetical protein